MFKVIEDYEEARALSAVGLLWYHTKPPAFGPTEWTPDDPKYWVRHGSDIWREERGRYIYAVLLEE